jgi:hypothetical protein
MRLKSFASGIVTYAFLMLAVFPAQASVLGTYTDRATWESVTSGRFDIDFESLGLAQGAYSGTAYTNASGLTIGGVNFVGVDGGGGYVLYAVNPSTGDVQDFGSATVLKGPYYRPGAYYQATMPAGVTSLGLDLMSIFPAGATFQILLDGIDLGVIISTQSRPDRTFFGVQTDLAFSQVRIVLSSGTVFTTQPLIDNFAYGTVLSSGGGGGGGDETVEIATLLYVGTGVVLLAWGKRRRQSAPAAV